MRTELGRSQVEVQQCALSSEVGEELGEELARRKWRWKLMQTWSRRNWRSRRRRRRRSTALIKSNNPHLAGGEKTKFPGTMGPLLSNGWIVYFFLGGCLSIFRASSGLVFCCFFGACQCFVQSESPNLHRHQKNEKKKNTRCTSE